MKRFGEYNFFKKSAYFKGCAKEAINGNRKSSIGINFIFWLIKLSFFAGLTLLTFAILHFKQNDFIILLSVAISFLLISALFYGPLRISVCKNAINMVENTNPSFKDIKFGFKKYFKNVAFGLSLFFRYLISLIFLVFPFFLTYINSQFAPYILAQDTEISIGEAFKQSKSYIKNFKASYVKLVLSYWLKFFISIITIYIYSLFARPLFNCSIYCLYKDLKS